MAWGRQICKLVIYCSVVGFTLVLFGEFGLPILFDYIWHVPDSPSKSLEAILAHRIELRNLETELNIVLHATNHPVNDHGIPRQNEIAQQYDEYFDAIEDYTKDYGKLEYADIERFVRSHEKISKTLDTFVEKHEELSSQRRIFLTGLAHRVTDVAETTKSLWTLVKHFDVMAEYGMILDVEQPKDEFEDENSNIVTNLKEDDACIEVMQKLVNLMNDADGLSKRMFQKVRELNALLNEESLPPINGNNIDVEQELEYFRLESKRLKTEMVNIFKTNKQLLGKTNSFITAASARVRNLASKVLKKEGDVWMEEMNIALMKIRDKASRSSQLIQKLTSNVNLRIAPDLDKETSDHSEL